jgi:hypothetical protein
LLAGLILPACGLTNPLARPTAVPLLSNDSSPTNATPAGDESGASSPSGASGISSKIATRTPFLPMAPSATVTPTDTPLPTPTPLPAVWLAPYLPAGLSQGLTLPAGLALAGAPEQAVLRLEVGNQLPVSQWVYALVAPFPTLLDGVNGDELRRSWQGEAVGPFAGQPLLMDESTYGVFSSLWGAPPAGAVNVMPADQLAGYAWDHRPAWAIVPFESLEPRWKVLQVDGRSPLWKEFNPDDYALSVTFSLDGDPANLPGFQPANLGIPATDRNPDQLTTVLLTGVTALVRATAFTMHRNGILYPALDIRDILRGADILHISNEIPFAPDCPPPNPNQVGLRFCSDPSYIALLEDIGTDVVELTGDHFADWGPDAMRYTLDMYKNEGWIYYGGGYNLEDGRQARLIEQNGNRIAFIGCNSKKDNYFYATASDTNPGAVACDYDWMHSEIAHLKEQGYQVIVTFQDDEYYTYYAQPDQIADSRGMIDAGAVIVSGSQAHHPQGLELYNGEFIHYGLGNLFFDQWGQCQNSECDNAFMDRHVFYAGRYISTELLTIKFIDFARPRLMTPEERQQLLQAVFSASGW